MPESFCLHWISHSAPQAFRSLKCYLSAGFLLVSQENPNFRHCFYQIFYFSVISPSIFSLVWRSQKEVQREVLNTSLINICITIYAYTSENLAPWLSSKLELNPKYFLSVHFERADVSKCCESMNKSGNTIFELTAWSNFCSNFPQQRRSWDDS